MSDSENNNMAMTVYRQSALVPASLEQAVKLAELMAASGLVPDHLRNQPANCLMVIEQASRWGMSPFAVAQCTSVIRGRLMYEGKLVAAVVNARGELSERLNYMYEGSGANLTVTVYGKLKGEKEPRDVKVVYKDVVTSNDCWKRQPEQQLGYAGVRFWARRHLPEVMLGVYSPEERFDDDDTGTPTPGQELITEVKRLAKEAAEGETPKAHVSNGVTTAKNSTETGTPEKDATVTEGVSDPKAPTSSTFVPTAESGVSAPAASTNRAASSLSPASVDIVGPDCDTVVDVDYEDLVECWEFVGDRKVKKWGQEIGKWEKLLGREPKRTLEQNNRIQALKRERGYGDNDPKWKERLEQKFNKSTSADLSVREAGMLIDALEQAIKLHGTAAQKEQRKERRTERMVGELSEELAKNGVSAKDLLAPAVAIAKKVFPNAREV
jgi:hypothetical protein